MEKYLLLKLGMNVSEVEKVLEQKIILQQYRPDINGFYFSNYALGTYLSFTYEKKLSFISFKSPFSLAVDGITIGMNMNEVEKIKGLPETQESSEKHPEIEEWFYPSNNTTYLFVENKVYDITHYNFSEDYLTKDDVEALVNAVSGVDKIDKSYFEITSYFENSIKNGDIVISSSFDMDKIIEEK